ncbi:MAG: hypothetical protein Q9227_002024 [Pyrenula ochraceoflavens]
MSNKLIGPGGPSFSPCKRSNLVEGISSSPASAQKATKAQQPQLARVHYTSYSSADSLLRNIRQSSFTYNWSRDDDPLRFTTTNFSKARPEKHIIPPYPTGLAKEMNMPEFPRNDLKERIDTSSSSRATLTFPPEALRINLPSGQQRSTAGSLQSCATFATHPASLQVRTPSSVHSLANPPSGVAKDLPAALQSGPAKIAQYTRPVPLQPNSPQTIRPGVTQTRSSITWRADVNNVHSGKVPTGPFSQTLSSPSLSRDIRRTANNATVKDFSYPAECVHSGTKPGHDGKRTSTYKTAGHPPACPSLYSGPAFCPNPDCAQKHLTYLERNTSPCRCGQVPDQLAILPVGQTAICNKCFRGISGTLASHFRHGETIVVCTHCKECTPLRGTPRAMQPMLMYRVGKELDM